MRYPAGRHAWLQVIRGGVRLNDKTLNPGDGAAISNEKTLDITAIDPAEIPVRSRINASGVN